MPAATSLLGHPRLLEAVSQLVQGAPFVSTTENLIFKLPGVGFGHRWHQDPAPLRCFPSIMVGIYLDNSRRDSGALRVIPRSHLAGYWGEDELIQTFTGGPFETPTSTVAIEVEPGDVVFHATSLIHGSQWSAVPELRRTIYFQFDHFQNVRLLPQDAWTRREYMNGQSRLVNAIDCRRLVYPNEIPFKPSLITQECLQ
jgi:ectoine hydroxylase-related dioxygenase (phytanoyl-CoA dioxygenase family)